MRILLLLSVGLLAAATPASACRVGGDDLIFVERPTPPTGDQFSTIAQGILSGEKPGPDLRPTTDSPRGFLVGALEVRNVFRGPRLPKRLPAYLEVVTSCSNFFRGPKGLFTTSGYVVGRLAVDRQGPYLILRERNASREAWN